MATIKKLKPTEPLNAGMKTLHNFILERGGFGKTPDIARTNNKMLSDKLIPKGYPKYEKQKGFAMIIDNYETKTNSQKPTL